MFAISGTYSLAAGGVMAMGAIILTVKEVSSFKQTLFGKKTNQ